MIRYALACEKGHDFESWFRDSDSFARQLAAGLVECPLCGSVKVEKQIMAPQVARTDRLPVAPEPAQVAMMAPEEAEFRRKLRELRDHVTANAENVGKRFPEVARQMHYEEIEKRSIYGEANAEETRELMEEGIEFHPLPFLGGDGN